MDIFASNGSSAQEENEGSTQETVGDVPNPIESTDGPLSKLEMPDSHRGEYLQDQQNPKKEETKREQQNTNKEEAKKVTEDQKIPPQPAWLQAVKSAWNYACNVPVIGPYRKIYLEELQKSKEEETKQEQQNLKREETKQEQQYLKREETKQEQHNSNNEGTKEVEEFDAVTLSPKLVLKRISTIAWQSAKGELIKKITASGIMHALGIVALCNTPMILKYFNESSLVGIGACLGIMLGVGAYRAFNESYFFSSYKQIEAKISVAFSAKSIDAQKKLRSIDHLAAKCVKILNIITRNEYQLTSLVIARSENIKHTVNLAVASAALGFIALQYEVLPPTIVTSFLLLCSMYPLHKQGKRYAADIMRIAEKNTEKFSEVSFRKYCFTDPHNAIQIKLRGLEDYFKNKIIKGSEELKKDEVDAEKRGFYHNLLATLFSKGTASVCAFSFFVPKALTGELKPEALIMLTGTLFSFYESLSSLITNWGKQNEYFEFANKIINFINRSEIIEKEEESRRTENLVSGGESSSITFDHVSISLPNQKDLMLLDDVSVEIKAGEITIVVGPIGSGKTTLMLAAMNVLPPTKGRVLYGKQDIEKVKKEDINSKISFAGQGYQPFPFDSIKDFVMLGRGPNSDVTFEEGLEFGCCKSAVDKLPKGGDTIFGVESEGSVTFSSGETEGFMLAVVRVRDTEIMFLDEPTANADPETTERRFKNIKDQKRKDRSILFVSHNLKYSAKIADTLIVMENHKIVAKGTHEELLKSNEWYRQAYEDEIKG